MKTLSKFMHWDNQPQVGTSKGKFFTATNDFSNESTEDINLKDEEVLQLLFKASNGQDNLKLYNGNISKYNDDQSAADLALVNSIVFYTRDTNQVDRIFRQSKLMRDKWDKNHSSEGLTYGEMTIEKSLSSVTEFYIGSNKHNSEQTFKLTPIQQIMCKSFDTDWLIKNLLPSDSTIMVFGASYSGKSLIAMEMAYCLGNGLEYYGNPVKQGHVVYIAGEGFNGINKRFRALEIKYGLKPDNIVVSEISMDLNSESNVENVHSAIIEIPDVNLIIIDTLHRNFTGDENASKDFATVLKHCDKLRNATGASVMLIHHSGHDSKSRGRGSSAMTAAMDVEYKVSNSNQKVTMKCTKMKDNETPGDINFDLKPVKIGSDKDGTDTTAPLLEKSMTLPAADKSACLNPTNQLTLDVLSKLSSDIGAPVSKADWKAACMEEYIVSSSKGKAHEAKTKRFGRSFKLLLESDLVVEDSGCFIVAGHGINTKKDD